MKIGLIDVDGHNFPNLALMKISAYHKSIGDNVEWAMFGNYDRTYMSKIFTFSLDQSAEFGNLGEIIKGGTGYNLNVLPAEFDNMIPDYSIYPKFKEAYGFLTRGCCNKCSWCIVPKKEGEIKPYSDIEDFLQGRKSAVLMDNNVLAHEHGLMQLEKIVRLKIRIDFNQGLDSRLIAKDEEIAKLLAKVKWLKPIRMACDSISQMDSIEKATVLLRKYGAKPTRFFVYVLVKEVEDALKRVEFLRKLNLDPFAQPFRNFENNTVDPNAKKFARYVNHKAIFKSVKWENYDP